MFAAGRNVYSLSRAGYYPKFLSLTGGRKTPYVALIASAVVGIVLIFGLGAIAYGSEERRMSMRPTRCCSSRSSVR